MAHHAGTDAGHHERPADAMGGEDNGANWDLITGVQQTLVDTGAVLTQGLTSIANSLTGWVADLASAFDGSGWNESDELPPG